jgi:hypothetical protein
VGLVAAVLVIIVLAPVLQNLYPRLDVNPLQVEGAPLADSLPPTSLMLLLGAYALASFIGGFAASLTAGRTSAWPAIVTGVILMVAGSYAVLGVPDVLWFWAASFLTYPLAYLGHLLVRKSA